MNDAACFLQAIGFPGMIKFCLKLYCLQKHGANPIADQA